MVTGRAAGAQVGAHRRLGLRARDRQVAGGQPAGVRVDALGARVGPLERGAVSERVEALPGEIGGTRIDDDGHEQQHDRGERDHEWGGAPAGGARHRPSPVSW